MPASSSFVAVVVLVLTTLAPTARGGDWAAAMRAARGADGVGTERGARAAFAAVSREFPIECDWLAQDWAGDPLGWFRPRDGARADAELVRRAIAELGDGGGAFAAESARLAVARAPAADARWLDLYARACAARRRLRLARLRETWPRIVFTKHATLGGSHYAYTEAQSDAQAERHFLPGSALCVLDLSGPRPVVRTLLEDRGGMIRDPDVSYDGRRVLFAWKKADRTDDFHLYELDVASGRVRQLTHGLGFADYEGAYLPGGDIVFNSTRCVQTVDCFWTEVSNLYTCDADGRFLRRLCFDQVHDNFPTVLDDGRVIYTKWEYNDRGQIFPQPLYVMNSDGTAQAEFYGATSWFPTTILHARGIPGTGKVVAVLSGHHTRQTGKLAVIDPARGQQENVGVQLVAPVRPTPAERVDAYGQDGELFQYPYPLSETEFLVTYSPTGWRDPKARSGDPGFGIYFMTIDGRRELLASDPAVSCNQPVPLAARPEPRRKPSTVDYRKSTGQFYMTDVYQGPGLAGAARGTVKRLRVVELDYRAAGIGENGSHGPGGGALISTPVAVGNGTWDVKRVLGDATVYADGSAFFTVPARTPVYFQALDDRGRAVQTMRSWTMVQPNETASCGGCHETKHTVPAAQAGPARTLAARAGARPLAPFNPAGPPRGFSFPRDVQPILDRHCARCHRDGPVAPPDVASFSLSGEESVDAKSKRRWSTAYLALTRGAADRPPRDRESSRGDPLVNWISTQSVPTLLPPNYAGSTRSGLLPLLEGGHRGVTLSRAELETIACWIDLVVPYCGDYEESHAWTAEELARYRRFADKRRAMEELERENIRALTAQPPPPPPR